MSDVARVVVFVAMFRAAWRWHSTQAMDPKVLSIAEQAKALVHSRLLGTFTTFVPPQLREKCQEIPLYGSLTPYLVTKGNQIAIGLLQDSRHCKHVAEYDLCSLLVFPYTPVSTNPSLLPLPRVNLTGNLKEIEGDATDLRSEYLSLHPGAREYVHNYRFFTLKLNPAIDIGFFLPSKGASEYVSDKEYLSAPLDPLAKFQRPILDKMNDQSADLLRLIEYYANIKPERALMYFVDQYGCNVLVNSHDAETSNSVWNDIRLPFPFPVKTEYECNAALMEAIENVKGSN